MIVIVLILLVVVFAPSLWVRWVMNAYSQDIEGMPGTGGELVAAVVDEVRHDDAGWNQLTVVGSTVEGVAHLHLECEAEIGAGIERDAGSEADSDRANLLERRLLVGIEAVRVGGPVPAGVLTVRETLPLGIGLVVEPGERAAAADEVVGVP